ncbi:MAG: tRNA (guanine37-N1)-methyltransferase [Parasphingorhabdus sp.]|jgi:tRNA (guanine37-N1)-methyltransferase
MLNISVISIFPEMFSAIRNFGMTRKALENGQLSLDLTNLRDFTTDSYRRVDDRPYGGGPGMVMMPEPLDVALSSVRKTNSGPVVYLSPQGKLLDQQIVRHFAEMDSLVLLAGRYEGVDERVLQRHVDEEVSIGDYVVAGGELPAMVLIDSMVRWLPGVLGNQDSAEQDSFSDGLLDCRHYTRPESWQGKEVPSVLMSGDHNAIRRWRLKDTLGRTWLRRPDLLSLRALTAEEADLLEQFKDENSHSG